MRRKSWSRRATLRPQGPITRAWYDAMSVSEPSVPVEVRAGRRYLRPPRPIVFPESAVVPETGIHLDLRTALYLAVRHFLGDRGAVGSEQFVYWDPQDPRKCLAPDLIVRMGAKPGPFPTWKTWERGAPHLGVEIVSHSDAPELPWSEKLRRYARTGIEEVVRFDPERPSRPLRLWDRVQGDLVERELVGENALFCDTLGLYWHVVPDDALGLALRLAHDSRGRELLLLPEEKFERLAKQQEQRAEEQERRAAEAMKRVAELEAELRRRG